MRRQYRRERAINGRLAPLLSRASSPSSSSALPTLSSCYNNLPPPGAMAANLMASCVPANVSGLISRNYPSGLRLRAALLALAVVFSLVCRWSPYHNALQTMRDV